MSRRKNRNTQRRSGISAILRKPAAQLAIVAIVAFIVYLIASAGGGNSTGQAREINVDEGYKMYQSGAFVVDVRTQEEWDEYHAPNTVVDPIG